MCINVEDVKSCLSMLLLFFGEHMPLTINENLSDPDRSYFDVTTQAERPHSYWTIKLSIQRLHEKDEK